MTSSIFKRKKAQVAPFLILVVAVIILAIAATMLIGEVAFSRIRMGNVTDSALISAASGLCRSLNQIRQISNGPGGLRIHWLGLQAFLASHRTTCCGVSFLGWRYKGEPLSTGFYINSMLESERLYKEAERLAREAPKDLRIALYDRAFGGGLIDEPKPFLAREVIRDGNGRITGLDYNSYLDRDSRLTLNLREFKRDHPEGVDAWYNHNTLYYSYNKTRDRLLMDLDAEGNPLVNTLSNEPLVDYEAYLRTELQNIPENISVEAQVIPMVYIIWKDVSLTGCRCAPFIGIIPHHRAWIRRINNSNTSFGIRLEKLTPFRRVPFFGRDVELEHESRVRIQGGGAMLSRAYEFRMEE